MSNQITLFHFSDLHFGEGHRFNNEDADAPNMASLVNDSIKEYISQRQQLMMIVVTGDLINYNDQANKEYNFRQAFDFLKEICPKTDDDKIDASKVFIVPGNHDVDYMPNENNFDKYYEFYEKIHGKKPDLIELRIFNNSKVIIAEINSCSFVINDPKGYRGKVKRAAIDKLKTDLEKLKKNSQFEDYIKIALLHHHIVLLPPFIRKRQIGQNINAEIVNDTIVNDTYLIDVLNEYNFHLILHGHKHFPCQYIHDPNFYWDKNSSKIPILVIAGGSCGSTQLSDKIEIPCNTFNILQVLWKDREQITIKLTIKGLQTHSDDKKILNKWGWETIKYREFRIQYQQTNKCEWKVSISNKALDTPDALTYCLNNCLLNDSKFLSTVYSDQNYNNKLLTVYDISTLKYKYIEAVLNTLKKELETTDLNTICQIKDCYDISEKTEQEMKNSVKSAKRIIKTFLNKYQDGN